MKRIIATAAAAAILSLSLVTTPASAHELDPTFGGCHMRGGSLAGAWFNQQGHAVDRNGDGVVCAYMTNHGGFRFGDNHLHRH